MEARDGIVVLAATNRPNLIDPAFLRHGRLGIQVKVAQPQRSDYSELINVHLLDTIIDDGIDTSVIAAALPDGLSGADISGFVTEVKQKAIERTLDCPTFDEDDDDPLSPVNGFLITENDFNNVLAKPQWTNRKKYKNGAEEQFMISL
jgi:SpoVK/Ycf46/Vps4 family AAA+-type ATPase